MTTATARRRYVAGLYAAVHQAPIRHDRHVLWRTGGDRLFQAGADEGA